MNRMKKQQHSFMTCTSALFSAVVFFIKLKNNYNCFCDANVVLKERKLREQKMNQTKLSGCFFLTLRPLIIVGIFSWPVANMQILQLSRNIGEAYTSRYGVARFFSKSGACRRKKIRMRFFWHQCNFVSVYGIHQNEKCTNKTDDKYFSNQTWCLN